MERYYNKPTTTKSRIKNNEELYKKIYEMGEYSNVEGIATIENGNDIDISKVQELLKMREEKEKREKTRVERPEPIKVKIEQIDEDRNYDIRDVLSKAKESNVNHDDKMRSLKNTEYDILKGLDLKKTSIEDVDLKDLINTITHNSALNKLASEDTGSLLDDLISKSKTDTIDTKSINSIINEEKKKYDKDFEKDMEIDKSFYTSSFNFKEDDFETMADLNKNLKKRNSLIIVLIVIALIMLVLLAVFLFIK